MKIGNVEIKISIITIAVFVIFTILIIIASVLNADFRGQLFWIIPALIMLLVIPVALNYMSRKQYQDLEPQYREKAKTVRVRLINESMLGQIVRIEGVVEQVHFQFLNRPSYYVADRSGGISAKMFTSPDENIKKGDIVEVLGQVMHRFVMMGDPVINCVSIRKIDKKIVAKKKED